MIHPGNPSHEFRKRLELRTPYRVSRSALALDANIEQVGLLASVPSDEIQGVMLKDFAIISDREMPAHWSRTLQLLKRPA